MAPCKQKCINTFIELTVLKYMSRHDLNDYDRMISKCFCLLSRVVSRYMYMLAV